MKTRLNKTRFFDGLMDSLLKAAHPNLFAAIEPEVREHKGIKGLTPETDRITITFRDGTSQTYFTQKH